jgi:alpha-1,3-rhamnosyl/mannosyltransferase
MRVGFGVTVLSRCLQAGGVDGIGSYVRELRQALLQRGDTEILPVSFGTPIPDSLGKGVPGELMPRFDVSALVAAVTGRRFPGTARFAQKMDVFHATDHLIPRLDRVPVVASLMDAIPLSHPEWVPSRLGPVKYALWKRTARWAEQIITISAFSKREIAAHFQIAPARISVIPLGVDARWFQPVPAAQLSAVRQRLDLPARFFLFVGTLQPRKNVGRLIEAYRALPKGIRDEVPLIVVGRAGWQCQDVVDALNRPGDARSVRWLDYLPDDDLLAVIKQATALVFPSLCEGFGLPVLEAFAAGVPVITSQTSALPEVAGDAALLIDPLDPSALSSAMLQVLEDEGLAEAMRLKGTLRAREYTWGRTAAMTVDVYRRVAGPHPAG